MISKLFGKRIIFYTLIFSVYSCATFDKSSSKNTFTKEGQYIKFRNDNLNIENITFGGLQIIDNSEKEKKSSAQLKFKNIVYYASMNMGYNVNNVEYDYYILSRFKKIDENLFFVKKINCSSKDYYLVISKKISKGDFPLIFDSFKCIE